MYCRPSSYNNYSNLFFTHVHARLSKRERPNYFWNGLDRTTRGARLSSNFQRASALLTIICISLFYVSFGILLLVPTKIVIGNYLPSSHTLPLRAQILVSQANIILMICPHKRGTTIFQILRNHVVNFRIRFIFTFIRINKWINQNTFR